MAPAEDGNANVYVSHEETTVPFRNAADFQAVSVSKLTLDTETGAVIGAAVAIPASKGFLRFCSGSTAGPREGFSICTYLANEESNDIVDVPAGATKYNSDSAIAPQRQGGYVVALNAENDSYLTIPGFGRLNHENIIAVPDYEQLVLLTTDDTFSGSSAQPYMFIQADDEDAFWGDRGTLWAFRVTHNDAGVVNAANPFNGANDYLGLTPGSDFPGQVH